MSAPLFSIVINNYNYGKFLAQTIESCLAQTYQPLEVIVVDDGSTDDSRKVIASFGDRVIPVLKPNGGQGSAFNAGFQAAHGEYILFLDSDDLVREDAAALFAAGFRNPQISKVQARLRLIDGDGQFMGIEDPAGTLAEGDWKQRVLDQGPGSYPAPPSSGNTWSRAFLEAVMPMPEPVYFVAADGYLRALAPLFGPVASVQEPIVSYRVHGGNTSHAGWKKDPQWRLARDTKVYEQMCEDLARFATKLGHPKRAEDWTGRKWIHLLRKHVAHRGNAHDVADASLTTTLRAAAAHFGKPWKIPAIYLLIVFAWFAPLPVSRDIVLWLQRKQKVGHRDWHERKQGK